jgi:hypothetical protein
VSHKRHYVLAIDGKHFDVYCDTLPTGLHNVGITLRTHKIAQRRTGPNYDGSANSILAAIAYAKVHQTVLWRIWEHMYAECGVFISGRVLIDLHGTAALERVRELRHKYGWPIESKQVGPGVWWYCLNLRQVPPRKVRRVSGTPPLSD